MRTFIKASLLALVVFSCQQEPDITEEMLDGDTIFDPSLYAPEEYLLSYAKPDPTPEEALKPVIIACHGYTATTFEWEEFREWIGDRDDVYLSQVLLAGHGRSYEDFKESSWQDWQSAITAEYSRLLAAGYKNIHLLGSSTSCTLFLELLASDYFQGRIVPQNILMVDPIVIPSNKLLPLIGVVGPMLGYMETDQTAEEDKVYYRFRPQETLQQLQELITLVRKELERGIVLPADCQVKVYKSIKDPTSDPVSAVLIYKGLKTSGGENIEVELIDSELHVFTRLALVNNYTLQDQENQQKTFQDIITRVLQ